MDYKEKLRLAKEALESGSYDRETIEYIFPELKESEDERIIKELVEFVDINTISTDERHDRWIAWLEKQKPAKTPQWMIEFLDDHRRHFGSPMEHEEKREVDGNLLCIKEWLEGNCVEQKPAEWSGEDEAHLHSLITHLEQWIESNPCTTGADIQGENIAWLKSLRPQNRWKPSEEQMEALEHSLGDYNIKIFEDRHKILESLYQDLKKLREE